MSKANRAATFLLSLDGAIVGTVRDVFYSHDSPGGALAELERASARDDRRRVFVPKQPPYHGEGNRLARRTARAQRRARA